MRYHRFQCVGLDGYAAAKERIHGVLYRSFFYHDETFIQSIEAALQHAAERGSPHIQIAIRIMTHDISVTISAETKTFDVCGFRKVLQRLANDPAVAEMDWHAYVERNSSDAGIWQMLAGCAYLCMDAQSVTMVARRTRLSDDIIETRIGLLIPRFFAKKHGVVLS